jgi:hypothetical protein
MFEMDKDNLPIQITDQSQDGGSVSFRIDQNFIDGTVDRLAVNYHKNTTDIECDVNPDVNPTWDKEYTAVCFNGKADVKIYLYMCDNPRDVDCDYCTTPIQPSDFYEYTFILDCYEICETEGPTSGPTSAPLSLASSSSGCYDGPVVMSGCSDNVPIVSPAYVEGDYVTIQGNFSTGVDRLVIKYPNRSDPSEEVTVTLYTNDAKQVMDAKCTDGVSAVTVIVTIGGVDCQYIVHVPCKAADICNERRMNEESFQHGTVDEPSEDMEDVPYCVSEDFPCDGEEENMVYVCHYSTRQGYQTFCVPETDSDILRFYPHDYCGPCEGGYGNVGKEDADVSR